MQSTVLFPLDSLLDLSGQTVKGAIDLKVGHPLDGIGFIQPRVVPCFPSQNLC